MNNSIIYNFIKIHSYFFPVRSYKSYISVGKAGTDAVGVDVAVGLKGAGVGVAGDDVVGRIRGHDRGNYRYVPIGK